MAIPRIFRPVANTSMVHIRWTNGTNRCENTFAYRWTGGPPTTGELLSLAQEVWATIGVKMQRQMHTGNVFREVYARNIHTEVAAQATYALPANTAGQRGGGALALNEACRVTTRTGFTGRSNHGAKGFSGFVEGDLDGNSIGTQLMTWLIDLCLSIVAQRLAGRFTPAVASRKNATSVVITSALPIDNNVDSQKTRLNNRGD
jgi:hypothetical protein